MIAGSHRLLRRLSVRVHDFEGKRSVRIRLRTGRPCWTILPQVPECDYFEISRTDRLPVVIGMFHSMSGTKLARFLGRVLDGPYSAHGTPTPGPKFRDLLTADDVSRLLRAVGRGLTALEKNGATIIARARPPERKRAPGRSARRSPR